MAYETSIKVIQLDSQLPLSEDNNPCKIEIASFELGSLHIREINKEDHEWGYSCNYTIDLEEFLSEEFQKLIENKYYENIYQYLCNLTEMNPDNENSKHIVEISILKG